MDGAEENLLKWIRMKHTLYVDESGGHALTDTRSENFLLTGLSIENVKDVEISAYFEFLKRKHGIPPGHPFHSVDLFEARGNNSFLTPKKAKSIIVSLAEFIKIVPVEIKVLALSKKNLREVLGINPDIARPELAKKLRSAGDVGSETRDISYDILASNLFLWFSSHSLWRADSKGGIIAESRKESDHSLLTAFLQCKEPDNYRSNEVAIKKKVEKMTKRVTSIKFENKTGECAGLEFADLISYVSFLALNRRLTFRPIGIAKIWRAIQPKIHGGKIEILSGTNLTKWLPSNRVHKISNFAKSL
jgi:hypothetical protein